jgi:hypothetical protein
MTPEDKLVRSLYRMTIVLSALAGGIVGIVIVRLWCLTHFQVWMLNFMINHLMNGNAMGLVTTNFIVNSTIFSKFLSGFILGGAAGAGVVACVYKWNSIKAFLKRVGRSPVQD